MPFKLRALLVQAVFDETDDTGVLVGESLSEIVKVFPSKFDHLVPDAYALERRLNGDTSSQEPT